MYKYKYMQKYKQIDIYFDCGVNMIIKPRNFILLPSN